MSEPLPATVKAPLLNVALPARPTGPTSLFVHGAGRLGVGTLVTLSVAIVVRVWPPLVPPIVSGYTPAGVEADVVTLSVEEPAPVTDGGLKFPPAPVGNPLTLSATLP